MRFKQGDLIRVQNIELEDHDIHDNSLFLRDLPDTHSRTIGRWETAGDVHIFLSKHREYMKIITSAGSVGWIHTEYYNIEKVA